jgi:hypothetical protein
MNQKVRVGDVFLVPIDGSRWGAGQIAGNWKGELYIIIFDAIYNEDNIDPERIVAAKPLLAALSLDAKLHHGDWRIIGNVTANLGRIPQPVFKVNQDGAVFVESRDRSATRPGSSAETEALRLRTIVAPVRLENALKAHNGIGDWKPRYDDLLYRYALESSRYAVS